MPTSSPDPITYVCKKIVEVKPNTVLDVGVGFGKYGFLAREYTDIWNDRYFREEWKWLIKNCSQNLLNFNLYQEVKLPL